MAAIGQVTKILLSCQAQEEDGHLEEVGREVEAVFPGGVTEQVGINGLEVAASPSLTEASLIQKIRKFVLLTVPQLIKMRQQRNMSARQKTIIQNHALNDEGSTNFP